MITSTASRPAAHPVALAPARRLWLLRHASTFVAVEIIAALALLYLLARSTVGIVVGGLLVVGLLGTLLPLFGGRSLAQWTRVRLAYGRRQPSPVQGALAPVAEWVPRLAVAQTQNTRGDEIGTVSDGSAWTAVLAFEADDDLLAGPGAELDLGALDRLTGSDDIAFAGIQVISYTVPAPTTVVLGGDSAAARAYAEFAGRPPPAVRRTWLCVRLDPTRCLAAVERRGVGVDGINATLRFGVHRIQSELRRQGVDTRVLSADELVEVLAITAGVSPDPVAGQRSVEHWAHWHSDGFVHTGREIRGWGAQPSRAYQRLLDTLAGLPVLFAVSAYTVSPGRAAGGGIRVVTPTPESADHALATVAAALGEGVRSRGGEGAQVPMLLATLPLGRGVPR